MNCRITALKSEYSRCLFIIMTLVTGAFRFVYETPPHYVSDVALCLHCRMVAIRFNPQYGVLPLYYCDCLNLLLNRLRPTSRRKLDGLRTFACVDGKHLLSSCSSVAPVSSVSLTGAQRRSFWGCRLVPCSCDSTSRLKYYRRCIRTTGASRTTSMVASWLASRETN